MNRGKTKAISIILIIVLLAIIGFYIYAYMMGKIMQKEPQTELSVELKKLENTIRKESKFSDTYFQKIPSYELANCDKKKINQYINVYNNNDSIGKTRKEYETYSKNVFDRYNELMMNKDCTDSVIIKFKDLKNNKDFRFPFSVSKK